MKKNNSTQIYTNNIRSLRWHLSICVPVACTINLSISCHHPNLMLYGHWPWLNLFLMKTAVRGLSFRCWDLITSSAVAKPNILYQNIEHIQQIFQVAQSYRHCWSRYSTISVKVQALCVCVIFAHLQLLTEPSPPASFHSKCPHGRIQGSVEIDVPASTGWTAFASMPSWPQNWILEPIAAQTKNWLNNVVKTHIYTNCVEQLEGSKTSVFTYSRSKLLLVSIF